MDHSISIIIPTYNEEDTIVKILKEIEKVSKKIISKDWKIKQVIVADGGSSDLTIKKVKETKIRGIKIDLLEPNNNRLSKQQSIDMGVSASIGKIVIFIDADLQVEPKLIPNLLSPIKLGMDISIGVRPRKRNASPNKLSHLFFSHLFNILFRNIFKIKIFDTQCGFKAFKRNVWLDIGDSFVTIGYAFDADFIVKAIRKDFKLAMVPIPFKHRYAGCSKLKLTHRIIMILDLFKIVFSIKN